MANLGTVVFRGHSGEKYRFQVWPVGTKFKTLAAVCVFTKRSFRNRNFTDTASHECVHIGQTPDLSGLPYDAPYLEGIDCVCVHLVANAEQRLRVEQDLAESLGLWNKAFRVDLGTRASPDIAPVAAMRDAAGAV